MSTSSYSKLNKLNFDFYKKSQIIQLGFDKYLKALNDTFAKVNEINERYSSLKNKCDKRIIDDYNKYITVYYWYYCILNINNQKEYNLSRFRELNKKTTCALNEFRLNKYKQDVYNENADHDLDKSIDEVEGIEGVVTSTLDDIDKSFSSIHSLVTKDKWFSSDTPISINIFLKGRSRFIYRKKTSLVINNSYEKIPKKQTMITIKNIFEKFTSVAGKYFNK